MQPTSRSGGKTSCLPKRLIIKLIIGCLIKRILYTVSVAYRTYALQLASSSMSHANVMGLCLHNHNYRAGESSSIGSDNKRSCRQNNKWAACCRLRTLILSFCRFMTDHDD